MYFILFRTICPSKAHFPLDSFLNFNRTAGQFSHSFLVHPRRRHRDAERIPHLSQIVTQTDSDTPYAGLILLIVQSVALIFHRVQLFQEMFKIRDRLRCPGHDMTVLQMSATSPPLIRPAWPSPLPYSTKEFCCRSARPSEWNSHRTLPYPHRKPLPRPARQNVRSRVFRASSRRYGLTTFTASIFDAS